MKFQFKITSSENQLLSSSRRRGSIINYNNFNNVIGNFFCGMSSSTLYIIFIAIIIALTINTNVQAKDYKQTEDIINSILNEPLNKNKQNQEIPKKNDSDKSDKDEKDSGEKDAPIVSKADEVYYKTGIRFYNSEQYAQAMKNFEELKSKYPKSQYLDSSRIWIGKIKIKDYKYDDAIREFSGVNMDSGEYPSALFLTGDCYQYKRDYLTSLEYYEKVSSQFPQHDLADKAILKSAKLYVDNKNGTQALFSAVKLIKYYSNKDTIDDAYYLIAKIYEKDQSLLDIETARKFYRLFLKKASAGDPLFAKSPLLKRVESDLKRLERDYFKLEK
jgi:TolA-binding protein